MGKTILLLFCSTTNSVSFIFEVSESWAQTIRFRRQTTFAFPRISVDKKDLKSPSLCVGRRAAAAEGDGQNDGGKKRERRLNGKKIVGKSVQGRRRTGNNSPWPRSNQLNGAFWCKLDWMNWLIARAWNKVVSHSRKFLERIEFKTGRENRSPSLKIIPQLIKRRKKRNWSKLRTKFECNPFAAKRSSHKRFLFFNFFSYSIASGRWDQRRLRLLRDDPGHVHHEHEPGGAERGKKRTILNKNITWEIGWMF